MSKIIDILIFLLSAASAAFFFFEWQMLGFPDGHLGQLDHVRKFTYILFSVSNIGIAFYSALSITKKSPNSSRNQNMMLPFIFVTTNLLIFTFDHLCHVFFYDGAGG